MTENEQADEKLRRIEQYMACQSAVECLCLRIARWHGALSKVTAEIKGAGDLGDCQATLGDVAREMGDVRADIDGLMRALHERRQLEEALRRLNAGTLIQRP